MPAKTTDTTKIQRLRELAHQAGILRARDLEVHGIPRSCLQLLYRRGELVRAGRGLYVLADLDYSEHHMLAEATRRVPGGVLCLLTALRFHGLTTQNPARVWMALHRGRRRPMVDSPSLQFVWYSGSAFSEGVEEHIVEKVPIRVYSAAKTVADCFRHRNRIGLDVALEALRDYRRQRRSIDELWHFARIGRMTNVILPYLEAMS